LDGLALPDEHLHELMDEILGALDKHDRETARKAAATAQTTAPDHWLTLRANLILARYDGNVPLALELLERLLKTFPDEPRLLLEKLSSMVEHDQRDERLGLLARTCEQPHPHPVFLLRYAQELCEDSREHTAALKWLRRAMCYGQDEGLTCLASLFWRGRQ